MNTITRAFPLIAGAAVLAVALSACTTDSALTMPSYAPAESKTFDLSSPDLTVNSNAADITFVAADTPGVTVKREVSGAKVGDDINPAWTLDAGTLTLAINCTGVSLGCHARYTVTLPRNLNLTAKNNGGTIAASGFTNAISIEAKSSSVELSDLTGPALRIEGGDKDVTASRIDVADVTVAGRNGDVDLGFLAAPRSVSVKNQDGNVRIGLPSGTYAVDTTAKKGDITVNVPRDDTSDSLVRVQTRNGDITIDNAG